MIVSTNITGWLSLKLCAQQVTPLSESSSTTVRYGGFTAAAAELSVSSAAISLQVRAGGKALRLWSAFPVPPLLWSVPLQQERGLLG